MINCGDFRAGAVVHLPWATFAIAGESITRATNGTVAVWKNASTTQSTVGVTDTEDFDSFTGFHLVTIDTAADGAFYAAGNNFTVAVTGMTVDGKAINQPIGIFSIENRTALLPSTDSLAATERTAIADALLDRAAGVETGWTPRQALRVVLASLAGKLSGAATTTVTIRDVTDAKDRIVATVDADGNRTAVTADGT